MSLDSISQQGFNTATQEKAAAKARILAGKRVTLDRCNPHNINPGLILSNVKKDLNANWCFVRRPGSGDPDF